MARLFLCFSLCLPKPRRLIWAGMARRGLEGGRGRRRIVWNRIFGTLEQETRDIHGFSVGGDKCGARLHGPAAGD